GIPDRDPSTGLLITEPVEERTIPQTSSEYQFLGKINAAVSPEHQGQLTARVDPGYSRTGGIGGLPQSTTFLGTLLITDVTGKWTSKFNDNKTEIEGVVGWHRSTLKSEIEDPAGDSIPAQILYEGDLSHYTRFGGETDDVRTGCADGSKSDPYPGIVNCPMQNGYSVGGTGAFIDEVEQRLSANARLTHPPPPPATPPTQRAPHPHPN